MTEPATSTALHASTSVIGGLAVLLGPTIGPWAAVGIASFVGALWTVGAVETESRLHAGMILVRTVLTALILTGALAAVLVSYTSVSLDYILPLTAFAIGALSDRFGALKDAAVKRLQTMIGGATP